MAVDWGPYDAALHQLAADLRSTEDDLAATVCDILRREGDEFVRIKLYPPVTDTMESRVVLYPSDSLLCLMAAVRTNDRDGVTVLKHRLFPPELETSLSGEGRE